MASQRIYVVIAGGIVMGAYHAADSAELHKRCITGATVVSCDLFDSVPPEILEDIHVEWASDPDDDTPVTKDRSDIDIDEID